MSLTKETIEARLTEIAEHVRNLEKAIANHSGSKMEDNYFEIDTNLTKYIKELDKLTGEPSLNKIRKGLLRKLDMLADDFEDKCDRAKLALTEEEIASNLHQLMESKDELLGLKSSYKYSNYKDVNDALVRIFEGVNNIETKNTDVVENEKKSVIKEIQNAMYEIAMLDSAGGKEVKETNKAVAPEKVEMQNPVAHIDVEAKTDDAANSESTDEENENTSYGATNIILKQQQIGNKASSYEEIQQDQRTSNVNKYTETTINNQRQNTQKYNVPDETKHIVLGFLNELQGTMHKIREFYAEQDLVNSIVYTETINDKDAMILSSDTMSTNSDRMLTNVNVLDTNYTHKTAPTTDMVVDEPLIDITAVDSNKQFKNLIQEQNAPICKSTKCIIAHPLINNTTTNSPNNKTQFTELQTDIYNDNRSTVDTITTTKECSDQQHLQGNANKDYVNTNTNSNIKPRFVINDKVQRTGTNETKVLPELVLFNSTKNIEATVMVKDIADNDECESVKNFIANKRKILPEVKNINQNN